MFSLLTQKELVMKYVKEKGSLGLSLKSSLTI